MSYQFHGQRSNEEVVLLSKQHPLVLLHPMLIAAAILLLPFVFHVFLVVGPFLMGVLILSILTAGLYGFLKWYYWNNSLVLLTNERVVVLEQKNWLHREFSECKLTNIQQVSHEVKGVLHTFFNFGTISILTGGSLESFTIPNVPNPYEIQQEILRASEKEGFLEEDGGK